MSGVTAAHGTWFAALAAGADLDLWGLFISAFISSTLFPGGSEVVVAGMSYAGRHSPWLLLAVATFGNTLGGLSTYALGRLLARRVPLDAGPEAPGTRHAPAIRRMRRWGAPALLLSWLPVAGDPLCFAAGWLRVNTLQAALFIGAGKAARYGAIIFFMA